jgi:hypothetical protein
MSRPLHLLLLLPRTFRPQTIPGLAPCHYSAVCSKVTYALKFKLSLLSHQYHIPIQLSPNTHHHTELHIAVCILIYNKTPPLDFRICDCMDPVCLITTVAHHGLQ